MDGHTTAKKTASNYSASYSLLSHTLCCLIRLHMVQFTEQAAHVAQNSYPQLLSQSNSSICFQQASISLPCPISLCLCNHRVQVLLLAAPSVHHHCPSGTSPIGERNADKDGTLLQQAMHCNAPDQPCKRSSPELVC
jgi:hypothetical protein